MRTFSQILRIVGVVVVSSALAVSALAGDWGWQRDAGAKARGDYGGTSAARSRSSASYGYRSYGYRSYSYEPTESTRRSFSYEPATQNEFRGGDTVVVTAQSARLMRGCEVLATVPKGTSLKVLKTQGAWLGTSVEAGGKKTAGWILAGQVAVEPPVAKIQK